MLRWKFQASITEVVVAQLVRAPLCGSGGRRFKSGLPPILTINFFALKHDLDHCQHHNVSLFSWAISVCPKK